MTAKSASQLSTEIIGNVPSGNPAVLTAQSLRQLLQDMIDSLSLGGTPFNLTVNIGTMSSASISGSLTGASITLGSVGVVSGALNLTGSATGSSSNISVSGSAGLIINTPSGQSILLQINGVQVALLNNSTLTLGGSGSGAVSGLLTFTGSASGSNASIGVNAAGNLISISGAAIGTSIPQTFSGTSGTLSPNSPSVIIAASGTFTLTLPAPSSLSGAWITLKSTTTFPVNSASANVVPLGSTSPGSSIFTSSAQGKWVELQSDGTNWITMMGSAGQ